MPIHDQSYRRYDGGRSMPGQAWTVIARAGILNMIRKRAFLAVLLGAWIPFVGHAVWLYVNARYPQVSLVTVTPKTFRDFFSWQDFFVSYVLLTFFNNRHPSGGTVTRIDWSNP